MGEEKRAFPSMCVCMCAQRRVCVCKVAQLLGGLGEQHQIHNSLTSMCVWIGWHLKMITDLLESGVASDSAFLTSRVTLLLRLLTC